MKKLGVVVGITLAVLALAYCFYLARQANLHSSLAKVLAALESESMPATCGSSVDSQFLAGKRYLLTLENGEHLSVYVYRNNKLAQKDASYVDGGGCSYSKPGKQVHVSWAGYPHLFLADNIIVLYVGDNAGVLATLEKIYGEQFAGVSE